jgi:hypothetical protein
VVGPTGDGEEMRRRKERLWLNLGRRMRYIWTVGRASVNFHRIGRPWVSITVEE